MKKCVLFLFSLALLAVTHRLPAQGTAFTYQGQLNTGGGPASGLFDFTFALFNNNSTNTGQVGGTVTDTGVGVTNGLFTVTLDFGSVFTGNATWLAIGVRTNGGAGFTALSPLQELTPTPYAIYANNAATAASAGSVASTNIIGSIPLAQFPAGLVTNTETGLTLNGAFSGDGGGLTNLDASQLTTANTGFGNFFIGSAGNSTTSGLYNTANGAFALNANTSGAANTANGFLALNANTTGSDNTANGSFTLYNNTTGSGNTASGSFALYNNTTGNNNTANGNGALINNTSGSNNTANGNSALSNNTVGSGNTASGLGALNNNTTGNNNAANGSSALYNNTSGSDNTANGNSALYNNTVGSANTANGSGALHNNTSGSNNTANGVNALYLNTSGSNNVALGYQAGYYITGSTNIDIGNQGLSTDNGITRLGDTQTAAYIAGVINGNGAGLINLPAANLTGALPAVSGANLTSLNASQLTSGTVPVAQLSSDVALLDGSQTFSGVNSFSGSVGIGTNSSSAPLDVYSSGFASALIDGSSIYGTWEGLRNSSVGGTNWFMISTGSGNGEGPGKLLFNTASGFAIASEVLTLQPNGDVGIGTNSPASTLDVAGDIHASGSFNGDGSGLTGLTAANLTGALPAVSGASLTGLTAANLTGALPAISGANLTALNASELTSGTIRLAQLPPTIAFLSSNQTFTGQNSFASSSGSGPVVQVSGRRYQERTRLTGSDFFEGNFDTNGVSLVLGVNLPNNRQLWVGDSGNLTVNSTNTVLRFLVGGGPYAKIDAVATDGNTQKPLSLGNGANVGIGTDTPATTLDVAGNIHTSGNVGIGTTTPQNPLDVQGAADFTGAVGVGMGSATHALLDVGDNSGSYDLASPNRGFTSSSGTALGTLAANSSASASIYAAGNIVTAGSFIATSDERVKNIEGRSDSGRDLATLLGIVVTDFRYKDVIAHGNRPQKKVIAQQVETVFPQAVSRRTDAVPDIYKAAACKDGWVVLATDLKKGERVKLISGKAEGVYPVLEVEKDRFRTDFKPAGDKLFVYGREVDDLRNVDYDAIAMLNVSATQELSRRLEKQAGELAARDATIAGLRQDLAGQKEELARMQAEFSTMQQAVARLARKSGTTLTLNQTAWEVK